MSNSTSEFQLGDKVAFDVVGVAKSPYGYGTVTRLSPNGSALIQPDHPVGINLRMTNIRKVAVKK